ncbi:MAG: PDC sensor domain-containing protein [Cocleimonas sp.]|nr:PDC sensor domain-containing protein [Cocleimonas sp.]
MNTQPTNAIGKSVKRQRELLNELLGGALTRLVRNILPHMLDKISLESYLLDSCKDLPYCKYLFVLDQQGKQITANLFKHGKDESQFGRDRSKRPYMRNVFEQDFTLSDAYISGNKKRPSLTAIQVIRDENNERIGFLGVDYDLRELPRTEEALYEEPRQWRQIKGDPAIRGGLFRQQRTESQMDKELDNVLALQEELMSQHGVYHCQIHFSSSRSTIWHVDDPYSYRILTMDELSDPNICLAYPKKPYCQRATVPQDSIMKIFEQFKVLRTYDSTVYLRSGSLNLVNGFIGLNFSCDGSHYLVYDDFLEKGLDFWFGV